MGIGIQVWVQVYRYEYRYRYIGKVDVCCSCYSHRRVKCQRIALSRALHGARDAVKSKDTVPKLTVPNGERHWPQLAIPTGAMNLRCASYICAIPSSLSYIYTHHHHHHQHHLIISLLFHYSRHLSHTQICSHSPSSSHTYLFQFLLSIFVLSPNFMLMMKHQDAKAKVSLTDEPVPEFCHRHRYEYIGVYVCLYTLLGH